MVAAVFMVAGGTDKGDRAFPGGAKKRGFSGQGCGRALGHRGCRTDSAGKRRWMQKLKIPGSMRGSVELQSSFLTLATKHIVKFCTGAMWVDG